jgi:hypothetical protein
VFIFYERVSRSLTTASGRCSSRVLLNLKNLNAKIYPEQDDFIRFKVYVEDFSDLLDKMFDYQSRLVNKISQDQY